MSLEETLSLRSQSVCELCASKDALFVLDVSQDGNPTEDNAAYLCQICLTQIDGQQDLQPRHWHCLNESMWSEVPAVKILAWRLLSRLRAESWAQDLLDMLYLDEEQLVWAEDDLQSPSEEDVLHKDSNGTVLAGGDTVTLIKDLPVKGAGFTAKRGTAVRGISLVPDNANQIEGRVSGQQIVILTQFVKKSN
ncbi:MAG: PhnA domain-containing protein [Sneathiella sp.]